MMIHFVYLQHKLNCCYKAFPLPDPVVLFSLNALISCRISSSCCSIFLQFGPAQKLLQLLFTLQRASFVGFTVELASAEMRQVSSEVPKKYFILTPQYEPFWDTEELSYMYNGQSVREEMILKLPQMLRIASDFPGQDFSRLCIFCEGFRHLLLRSPIKH